MYVRALVLSCCAAAAAAQQIPLAVVDRVETAWPPAVTGIATDVAAGAFLLGVPARMAVVLRDQTLEGSLHPHALRHRAALGGAGLRAIATLPGGSLARRDSLAAVSAQGLHVMRLSATGFADACPPLAAWANVNGLVAALLPVDGVPTPLLLGIEPLQVRVATYGASGLVSLAVVPAPPNEVVRDAVLAQWVEGGLPEVVLLTDERTVAIDVVTQAPTAIAVAANDAGMLAVLPGDRAIAQLTRHGSDWQLATLRPTGVFVASPLLTFAKPPFAMAAGHLDLDLFPDVVVSTGEPVRHVMFGDAAGIQTAAGRRLDVCDYGAVPPPMPMPDNTAPVALDDVDYDGDVDLVIPSQAAHRLVVVRRVARQLAGNLGGVLYVMLDSSTALDLEVIGYDALYDGGDAPWAPPPPPPPSSATSRDALALRCQLPVGWSNQHQLLITKWPVLPGGTGDDGDADPGQGQTVTYNLALGDPAVHTHADFVVTFDAALSELQGSGVGGPVQVWPGQERFLLEYTICKPNGSGGFEWVGTPTFAVFGAKHWHQHPWEELAAWLAPEDVLEPWWVEETSQLSWSPDLPIVLSHPHEPTGNRWVGYHPIVRRKSAKPTVPATGVVPAGNAKVH